MKQISEKIGEDFSMLVESELLKSVPEKWPASKLKYIAKIINGDSLAPALKEKYSSDANEYWPYIASKDINVNTSTIDYNNGIKIPRSITAYKVAPSDSSLICIEGGSAGRKIAYTEQSVCYVNKLACIHGQHVLNRFIYYSLFAEAFQTQFKLSMSGLIGGVAISAINNFSIVMPPIEDQENIVKFLNEKTSQINEAISIKEKQIALLKERKQIIIQQAVTQGLNPDAPMKDSGVEWIGQIPKHWEILANRALFTERVEHGREGLPLLSVSIHSGVSTEEISEEENVRGRVKIEDKSKYILVKPGDIAFNMMRAWQGGIGAVSADGMVSPAYIVAKPKPLINAEYFELQYRCPEFIQQMDRYSKGITDFRKRLYWDSFKQLNTVIPPIEEQAEIVKHVKTISDKTEAGVSLLREQIEKLKEYKTTLINTAVTGKIKVA